MVHACEGVEADEVESENAAGTGPLGGHKYVNLSVAAVAHVIDVNDLPA